MTTYESATFSKGVWGSATDAEFRAWGAACQAALDNTLTLITANVNWGTTTLSGVAGTINAADWATYRFNDGGSQEIYIKVEWGRGSATAAAVNQFKIQFTLSKDSGFTQTTAVNYVTDGGAAAACTDYSWHASFSDGTFILTNDSAGHGTSNPVFVVIERSRDSDGTVNQQAAILLMTGASLNSTTAASSALYAQRLILFSPFSASSALGSAHTLFLGTTTTANEDAVVPVMWGYNGRLVQSRAILAMKASSLTSRMNVTVKRAGVDKAYRVNALAAFCFMAASATYRCVYRWE